MRTHWQCLPLFKIAIVPFARHLNKLSRCRLNLSSKYYNIYFGFVGLALSVSRVGHSTNGVADSMYENDFM